MPYEADAPLIPHDEAIEDDTIYDLRMNHVWRRVIGGILMWSMEHIVWIGTPAEITQAENWYAELVDDFYDETFLGGEIVYRGVLAARTTNQSFGTGGVLVEFDDIVATPHHDTDGFWVGGIGNPLVVPSGLGGFYSIYAEARLDAGGTASAFLEISINGTLVADNRVPNGVHAHPAVYFAALLAVGDGVHVILRTAAGTRDARTATGKAWSVRVGMFRVGV